MSRKKRAVPPATEGMAVGSLDEIRERISLFVEKKFDGNWSRFARTIRVPVSTVEEWKLGKRGVPSLESLRRVAQQRMSIDWLLVGIGSMEWEALEPTTDVGKLLFALRPELGALIDESVGELTANEAFARLLFEPGSEGLLRLAAEGILPVYNEAVREIRRRDDRTELGAWVLNRLMVLDAEAVKADKAGLREVFRELIERVESLVPEHVRAATSAAEERQRAEFARRQLQVDAATRKGFHAAAYTTAEAVGNAVRTAERALQDIAQKQRQPDPSILSRLDRLAVVLEQLESQVRRLQSATTTASPPRRKSTGGKKKRAARAGHARPK